MNVIECFFVHCGIVWDCITKWRNVENTVCRCLDEHKTELAQRDAMFEDFFTQSDKNCEEIDIQSQQYSSVPCFLLKNGFDPQNESQSFNLHCSEYKKRQNVLYCTLRNMNRHKKESVNGEILSLEIWKLP